MPDASDPTKLPVFGRLASRPVRVPPRPTKRCGGLPGMSLWQPSDWRVTVDSAWYHMAFQAQGPSNGFGCASGTFQLPMQRDCHVLECTTLHPCIRSCNGHLVLPAALGELQCCRLPLGSTLAVQLGGYLGRCDKNLMALTKQWYRPLDALCPFML